MPPEVQIEIDDLRRQIAASEAPKHAPRHREWIVDPMYRGDFPTISEAMAAASNGDLIRVRPGLYEESLQISKVLEIIGEDGAEIHAENAHVISFAAIAGRITNLVVRQRGGAGNWYGVDITQGRLVLEDCDISSESFLGACIAIHNRANPVLRHNRIHDGKYDGIVIYDQSAGVTEDNDIVSNTGVGILIKAAGKPVVRRNRIVKNGNAAIYIFDGGRGSFEDNDLRDNADGAWDIEADCLPHVSRRGNIEA